MPPVGEGCLVGSGEGLLGPGGRVVAAAVMGRRHRLVVPYTAAVSVAFVFLAGAAGVQVWTGRFGLGAAGAVIAATATTDYSVLVRTSRGRFLCRAGRVRQVATRIVERLPAGVVVTRIGGNLVTGEWEVGDRRYSVPRRHEHAMDRIAGA